MSYRPGCPNSTVSGHIDMDRYVVISTAHAQCEEIVDSVNGNAVKISGNLFGSNKAIRHSVEFGRAVEKLKQMAARQRVEPESVEPKSVSKPKKSKPWKHDENKDPVLSMRLEVEAWATA